MRIATANAWDSGLDTLSRRQADLTRLQDQLTTGKRVTKASDDPAAAARAERALAEILRADTDKSTVEASRVAMTQAESALGDVSGLLQRVRELVVASGNASYSDSDRAAVASELEQVRAQLLQIANQSDGTGRFLFGGQVGSQPPFVDAVGGVAYGAAPGEMRTGSPTGLPLSADGHAAFMAARTGNGVFVTGADPAVTGATIDGGRVSDPQAITGDPYEIVFSVSATTPPVTTYAVLRDGAATAMTAEPYVAGQAITVDGMTVAVSGAPANGDRFGLAPSTPTLSIFDTVDRAIADLRTPGRTGSQIAQSTAFSLRDLDSSMATVNAARASAGAALNRIDGETERLDDQKLAATTERSNAEDVDMVHAISEFQAKQSSYDAALKSYAMVQRLSLFQYVDG